jgi:hypothetical protein
LLRYSSEEVFLANSFSTDEKRTQSELLYSGAFATRTVALVFSSRIIQKRTLLLENALTALQQSAQRGIYLIYRYKFYRRHVDVTYAARTIQKDNEQIPCK